MNHVRNFKGETGPDFLFMDANAHLQRTNKIMETLRCDNIENLNFQFTLHII